MRRPIVIGLIALTNLFLPLSVQAQELESSDRCTLTIASAQKRI